MTPKYLPLIATTAAILSCTASIFAISSRLRAEPAVQALPMAQTLPPSSAASVAVHQSAPAQATSTAVIPEANAPLPGTAVAATSASASTATATAAAVATAKPTVRVAPAPPRHQSSEPPVFELTSRTPITAAAKEPLANGASVDLAEPQTAATTHDRTETRERFKQRLQEMTPQERQDLRSRLRSR